MAIMHGKLIQVRDLSTGATQQLHDTKEHGGGGSIQDRVGHIAWSPDGRRLACFTEETQGAGPPRRLRVWDTSDWREVLNDPVPTGDPPGRLLFDPEGNRLIATMHGQIRVWDGTPLPPERRYGRKIKQLVESLFERYHLRDVVREQIEGDPMLDAESRAVLWRWLDRLREDPDVLNSAAWDVAVQPGQPADKYELALRQIDTALRLLGEKNARGRHNAENTCGLVQHRLKRYADAEAALRRAIELRGEESPEDAVCLALVRLGLGRKEEARADLTRCRTMLREEKFKDLNDNPTLGQLLKEAQALLGEK